MLHDRNDDLVPAAESRRLASAMSGRGGFSYTEVRSFDHVRTSGGLWEQVGDGMRLYRHMYSLIRETE